MHDSFVINNTKLILFNIYFAGSLSGIEAAPNSTQSVEPSITSKGTEPMYVFGRFEVGTTDSRTPVYSFTPESGSCWSVVDTG